MAALSVQSIDRFIGKGNPLAKAGGARMLLRATGGNLRGAAMLAALARKESSFGAQAFVPNNFWGYGIHAGPSVNRAPTVEAMASRVYKALASPTGYYKTAKDPIQAISIYAPSSENNTGLYQSQVSQWLTSMGANPKADFRGGPQSVGPKPANRPAPGAAPSSSVTPGGLPQLGGPAGQRLLDLLQTTTQGALQGQMPGPQFSAGLGEIARGLSVPSPAQVIASTPTTPGVKPPAPVGPSGGQMVVGAIPGSPVAGQSFHSTTHQTSGLPGYPAYDYMAPAGTKVAAPVSGTIFKLSGHDPRQGGPPGGALGYSIYVRGNDGKSYFLTHLDKVGVKVGQKVRQGQQIAVVAAGPASWSSPHVHMGVHGGG